MTWFSIRKFLKYAAVVAVADMLPVVLSYMHGATGLSQVDWGACVDASGLVFVKSFIGGSVGTIINIIPELKHREDG